MTVAPTARGEQAARKRMLSAMCFTGCATRDGKVVMTAPLGSALKYHAKGAHGESGRDILEGRQNPVAQRIANEKTRLSRYRRSGCPASGGAAIPDRSSCH